jgi:predicted LPLAT superfamily acyltransferase
MSWRDRPEAGSLNALRLMEWLATSLGRRLTGYLLYPVVLYFLLVRGYERRASRKYLERVYQRPAAVLEIYRHMLTFARVTLDRIFLMSGRADTISMQFFNSAPLAKLVDEGQSGVFLAAHFGSFEAARLIAVEHPQVAMRIVVDSKVNPNFMARMAAIDPDFERSIIDPHGSAAELGVQIAAAMRDKQWVGFLADRVFGAERTIEVQFLGSAVHLPAGPFMVAAAFKAPVIALFPVLNDGGYDVYCEVLTTSLRTSRKTRDADLRVFAQQYMDCLETYVRKAPDNWFNFYDYFDDQIR